MLRYQIIEKLDIYNSMYSCVYIQNSVNSRNVCGRLFWKTIEIRSDVILNQSVSYISLWLLVCDCEGQVT